MTMVLNQSGFQQLIDENREWLGKQPRTLERDHIDMILRLVREIPPDWINDLHEEFPPSENHPPLTPRPTVIDIVHQFHDTYERLAPSFGYETREETREFDPESPNGKLMIAVVKEMFFAR